MAADQWESVAFVAGGAEQREGALVVNCPSPSPSTTELMSIRRAKGLGVEGRDSRLIRSAPE